MKHFTLVPMICEYPTVAAFADSFGLNENDLILTNEYIYHPLFSDLDVQAHVIFQEQYGVGEPTDIMVDAILASLHEMQYDRIVAVGGGTIIDIAKVLAVAERTDRTDQLMIKWACFARFIRCLSFQQPAALAARLRISPSSIARQRA